MGFPFSTRRVGVLGGVGGGNPPKASTRPWEGVVVVGQPNRKEPRVKTQITGQPNPNPKTLVQESPWRVDLVSPEAVAAELPSGWLHASVQQIHGVRRGA